MRPRLFDEAALIVKDGRAWVKDARNVLSNENPRRLQRPDALPYRSKLETLYAKQLDLELRSGLIKGWLYEPFSFKLASGKRYRVDFVTWGEEGITCIECKGHHKNLRDSLTHLKWAASKFPFFIWRKVWWQDGGWDGQYIVT